MDVANIEEVLWAKEGESGWVRICDHRLLKWSGILIVEFRFSELRSKVWLLLWVKGVGM